MAELKNPQGTLSLEIEDALMPPDRAGEFTDKEMQRFYKPPKGVGFVAEQCADQIEALGSELTLPAKFDPERLRRLGYRADAIDVVIADVEMFLKRLKQGNLMFDAEVGTDLLELRDFVEAMARHKPSLRDSFKVLFDFYKRSR